MSSPRTLRLLLPLLCSLSALHTPQASAQPPVDASTLSGKLLVGYQGWHATATDGAGIAWTHWSNDGSLVPGPATAHCDAWPDLREYPASVLSPVNFSFQDGSQVSLFSSQLQATTLLHFQWMEQYHIHGAFVQRFLQGLDSPAIFAARTGVAQHAQAAAEATGRVFALEYDVSGIADAELLAALQKDWPLMRQLTLSPAYLHHRGRPALVVWGLGFSDDGHPATPATAAAIQAYFAAQNVTLIGGLPTFWRTLKGDSRSDPAWTAVYQNFSVVHPWLVGRFPDAAGADAELAQNILPDAQLCQQLGLDYLPVVWPGFSWTNMHGGSTPLNQIPRMSGSFLWRQLDNVLRQANVSMLFGAMFDEMDEGTAMFKIAESLSDLPAGDSRFIYAGIDGDRVRSDWWLFLLGSAAEALQGLLSWPGAQRPALPSALSEQQALLAVAALLGRQPQPFELVQLASSAAAAGSSAAGLAQLCSGLVASAEFRQRALQPPQLTEQLYLGALGRQPDAAGRASTMADITAGRTAQRAAQLVSCGLAQQFPCPE
jgi:hypothetical protein